MTLADYQKTLQDARGHQLVYIEDFSGEGDEDFSSGISPITMPIRRASWKSGASSSCWSRPLAAFRARENDDGALLRTGPQPARDRRGHGVSESRVCQLHSQAIARLRAQIVGEVPKAAKRLKEKARG
jgi:RNA polymerase sigma factor for flagellar operon FliA